MGDRVRFTKIKRQDIFKTSFMDFKENNEIEFKKIENSNIAILYGPNGTGKTSLAKILDNNLKEADVELGVVYKRREYNEKNKDIFHVINDQNNRNIIAGETSDYFLGDNIKRECELKKYIDNEFSKLFGTTIQKELKDKFNISSGKSELINYISDAKIKEFVEGITNSRSRGNKIDRKDFIDKIDKMGLIDSDNKEYNKIEYEYIIQNFSDKKSIIYKITTINDIKMHKNVRKIEESEVALKILQQFKYIDECVVCDNENIDRDNLIKKKKNIKDNVIKEMDEKTKVIINDIIAMIDKSNEDPLGIKDIFLEAISSGEMQLVRNLKNLIIEHIKIFNNEISNLFKQCLNDSDIRERYNEYTNILKEQPEITDEELLFIKNIVSENIGKEIELQRDRNEGNKFNLFLNGEDILNVEREKLHLSNGEQNFISLAFEFLKAKKSKASIIILDDPISSFDSIYKNKIAFCIVRFLQKKMY